MNEHRSKINNSYESSDSGGSASSSERRRRSSSYDAMEKGTISLSNLLMPSTMTDYELYPTTTTTTVTALKSTIIQDEKIQSGCQETNPIPPSYDPDYDYYNEYSTTPLVYSWMPIVPGFSQDGTDNLNNFDHIVKRLQPQPLNISNNEELSTILSDKPSQQQQNYQFQRIELLDSSKEVTSASFSHQLEDSCNAMDLNISCHANETSNLDTNNMELSFNGKINEMNSTAILEHKEQFSMLPESFNDGEDLDEEEERIRNESFEQLKKEDSGKMLLVNEKSPEVVNDENDDIDSDENPQESELMLINVEVKPLRDSDNFIMNRLQNSLSELSVPASITSLPLSLSEMLSTYKQNLTKEPISEVKSSALFIPSHPLNNVLSMEWPELRDVKAHGIMYNRNDDCEEIELMRLRYTDKFIRAETTTSYTHRNGPTSAKKRIERLKILTQSPGSRLSHLANRRKVFSSANLKSGAVNPSHKGISFLIDKNKLYQKKKRNSAKKKTPGKKKTPRSAKRQQQQLQIAKPLETSIASSKRALFTSPLASKNSLRDNLPVSSTSSLRGLLPRRNLFSPQNSKRKRSPSPDSENRFNKNRRLDSPSKYQHQLVAKSKSFSVAAPLTSSGSLDEHYRKTLFYRTQSEMVLNQSQTTESRSNLGYRKPLSDVDKKKLLWSASTALQSKQINREHEKFKDHMSILCRLVKKVMAEFYNPGKSMSAQMQKFSNMMVYYVMQGKSFEDIYNTTKKRLETQNSTKISGYVAPEDYEKNRYIRKNSSLLLLTGSCSSLNFTSNNSDSLLDTTFDKSGSDTSLHHSITKTNSDSLNVLRENFNSRENSSRKKKFGGSESQLNKLVVNHTSTPSSSILKAKRQISF